MGSTRDNLRGATPGRREAGLRLGPEGGATADLFIPDLPSEKEQEEKVINDHSHRNADLEVNLQVTYSNPLLAVKPSPRHITGSKPSSRLSLITSINRDSLP